MVESSNTTAEAKPDPGLLAPNIAVKDLATMSEYERRMARAARYGLDASKVIGPQAPMQEMKPSQAFDRMAQGPKVA